MSLSIFEKSDMVKNVDDTPKPEPAVVEDANKLTKAELKAALPAQLRTKITDELLAKVNGIAADPMMADEIRNNFVSFQNVMKDGKFKIEDYLSACAYVTYKMMGYSNQAAYGLVFPDRITRMRSEGKDDKHISSFVSAYNKNKLVNQIMEQALIPAHVLNQDLFQQALNHQYYLMTNAQSEKVQSDAAKCLIDSLKPPEAAKVELDVTVKDHSGIGELRDALVTLAEDQMKRIGAGTPTKEIAHQELFEKNGAPVE